MTTEVTSGCKFTQLVTYHVLRDVHGDKLVAVVIVAAAEMTAKKNNFFIGEFLNLLRI